MLLEDQYGVGDVVDAGAAIGTVEEVALRVTQIRDTDGTLWYVPHGSIAARRQPSARATGSRIVDIPLAYDANVEAATAAVARRIETLAERPGLVGDHAATSPALIAVESMTGDAVNLQVRQKTQPKSVSPVSPRAPRARIRLRRADRARVGVVPRERESARDSPRETSRP